MYWGENKTKGKHNNKTKEYRNFLKSNFVGISKLLVLVYSNKMMMQKCVKPNSIIYIKNNHVVINGKNFYDQSINCDIKQYEEVRNLV